MYHARTIRVALLAASMAAGITTFAQPNKYGIKVPSGPYTDTWDSLKSAQGPVVVSGRQVRHLHTLGSHHGCHRGRAL